MTGGETQIWSVRQADPEEAGALSALALRSKAHWGYDEIFIEECREELTVHPERCAAGDVWLVDGPEGLLGYYFVSVGWANAMLEHLFVEPAALRQGIGGALIRHCVKHCTERGAAQISLDADPFATGFYIRSGFQQRGEVPSATREGRMLPRMVRFLPGRALGVASDLHLKEETYAWPFASHHRAKIDANWAALAEKQSHLFNGTVFLARNAALSNRTFSASLFQTDYAAFMGWRDLGFPDADIRNAFGSAVIASADNALILGVMADWTSNAGLAYPPGGSLDLSDLKADGHVDMGRSILRELTEETGLDPESLEQGIYIVIDDGPRISVAQILQSSLNALEIAESILAYNRGLDQAELDDVVIVRGIHDIEPSIMPGYTQTLIKTYFEDIQP